MWAKSEEGSQRECSRCSAAMMDGASHRMSNRQFHSPALLEAVVGLGANQPAPESTPRQTLVRVVQQLGELADGPVVVSSLYETEPIGPPQARFLNAAVLLRTRLGPTGLLDALQVLEATHGRMRTVRWGPRTLDLDVLWIRGHAIRTKRLVVPHPRLLERTFALVPLLEVAPQARHPEDETPLAACGEAVRPAGIVRVEGPTWAEVHSKL